MQALEKLKERLGEIGSINSAAAVLGWDQQTYMPPGGAAARADSLEILSKISHEMATASETANLLEQAEAEVKELDPDSDDAAYVQVARRDFDKTAKLPTKLVMEIASVTTLAYEEWTGARAANDYRKFAPWLEKILDLTRQVAEHLGYTDRMYDALIDQYEPGMKTSEVVAMYEAIKPTTIEIVKAVKASSADVTDEVLRRDYDEEKQKQFGENIVKALGYEFARGRQDIAVHPFCTSFSRDDVRITTRYERNWLPSALFGSMHETGHALYEQGVAARYDRNILCGGTSLGVHESQSRLWENLVGRSKGFWSRYYPDLQRLFPEALADVDVETFYRSINTVKPSLIRVEADEVTYNMHTLLRFEMENDLLEGKVSVDDAPAAWNAKMEEYLGITPPDDAHGILQDVHWSGGGIGYFPTYSIGNILSVQWFEQANKELGGVIPDQIAQGEFGPLRTWLQENVYQWGRKYEPPVLVKKVTGRPLDPAPYLNYLKTKYGEIYGL